MAITYVNDLRLSEMATGDNSGTWGTVTNTNLELIGEALGYGTEAITTNADTHASVIADGATDPVRALYVEYTGTLDSACTITISPNTVNKVCFIENGTSGSQNIIISQGSGANVTIPPGDTKAVYLNGAGSGAAVVDAFASLSVVDLKVQDDLTVTDDLIVGGDIDLEGGIDVNGTANLDIVDIDGAVNMATTALVTGVLTTTAATVFNGGFAANQESTIIAADGEADNAFVLTIKNQEATDDRSFGVKINAGSTATDTPFFIKTHDDGTELFGVRGSGQVRFVDGTASLPAISNIGDIETGMFFAGNDEIGFSLGGTETARFSGGRLLIGTVSTRGSNVNLQVEGTGFAGSSASFTRNSNDSSPPALRMTKSRGASDGAVTIVQANDLLGQLQYQGADGSTAYTAATISGEVDGTPGSSDMPGRLVFSTTSDGATSPTERMRIDSAGQVYTTTGITGANSHMATGYVADAGVVYARGLVASGARSNNNGYMAGLAIVNGDNAQNGAGAANGRILANIGGMVVTDDSNAGDDSGGDMTFWTKPNGGNLAERMRINSLGAVTINAGNLALDDGNLVIGTSGKGIDFSAFSAPLSGMSNELLDRYEEGTYSPVLTGASSGTDAGTGSYVIVGKLITVSVTFNSIGTGLSGNLSVNLPIAANPQGSLDMYVPVQWFALNWTSGAVAQYGYIQDAGATLLPFCSKDNVASVQLTGDALGTSTYLRFIATYEIA